MTRESTSAADGNHTRNGTPNGFTTLTPFIAVADGHAAVRFYVSVFGARVVAVHEYAGSVVHAELAFADGRLQLGEPNPAYHLVLAPAGAGDDSDDVCYSFGFYCPDVDVVVQRALAAGAILREPLTTFVSGDRYASVRDPFGVRWSIMTRVEDLSDEESAERVRAWTARS